MSLKLKNIIHDKNISVNDYGSFRLCVITHPGKRIQFVMSNGASYDVSLDYFLSWYKEPHYIYYGGRWIIPERATQISKGLSSLKFVKFRRIHSGRAVKVYMSNNTAYIVPWDTVLMACERRYEHFGGLTNESKKLTRKYTKKGRE